LSNKSYNNRLTIVQQSCNNRLTIFQQSFNNRVTIVKQSFNNPSLYNLFSYHDSLLHSFPIGVAPDASCGFDVVAWNEASLSSVSRRVTCSASFVLITCHEGIGQMPSHSLLTSRHAWDNQLCSTGFVLVRHPSCHVNCELHINYVLASCLYSTSGILTRLLEEVMYPSAEDVTTHQESHFMVTNMPKMRSTGASLLQWRISRHIRNAFRSLENTNNLLTGSHVLFSQGFHDRWANTFSRGQNAE